jgi:hypothetical protein
MPYVVQKETPSFRIKFVEHSIISNAQSEFSTPGKPVMRVISQPSA